MWVALIVFLADQPRFGLWLTIAVIARLAPRALLSLSAGSLVDRSNVRRLIVAIEFSRAVLIAVLAVMVSQDVAAPAVLSIMVASYAIAAPTRPALSAIVPAIAGERLLAVANAVLSTIRRVMTFVGPLLGVVVATSRDGFSAVPAGAVVIREGDPPDNLYVAIRGSLSVSVAGREVGTLGANDWFGEIGLFDQRPRTATVTVGDDATLWRIPGEMFLSVLENAGSAPSALLDGIVDRLAAHR